MTGWLERSIASIDVRCPQCDASTTMPTRFISSTTARPKCRQPHVDVMAAATRAVVQVVGEEHLADPEPVVERDHRQVVVQGVHALEVEGDRRAGPSPSPADVVGRVDEQVAVGPQRDPAPEIGQRPDRRLPGHDVIADVDGEIVDAGRRPAPQPIEIGQRRGSNPSGRPRPARRGVQIGGRPGGPFGGPAGPSRRRHRQASAAIYRRATEAGPPGTAFSR